MNNCECRQNITVVSDRKILTIALGLNITMFVIGIITGILAQSTGLIADALDMLADALAYFLGLLAVGRGIRFKSTTAALSGSLLLILGISVLIDVGRHAWLGSEPVSGIIIAVACISLIVNVTVLYLLRRFRNGEIHLRATWIFTRADVIANLGIILSGIIIAFTKSRYPDLIVGCAISLYVIKEAFGILNDIRR